MIKIEIGRSRKTEQKDYTGQSVKNNRKNKYLQQLLRAVGYREYAYREINPEYLTRIFSSTKGGNPVVYKLIETRSRLTAEVFNYVKVRDVKTKKVIENSPALAWLNNANYLENTLDLLIKRISVDYDLYGESFTYKETTGVSSYQSMKLFPMFPELVEVVLGGIRNPIEGFTVDYVANDTIDPEEVMWLRSYNPNPNAGYRGLSPLVTASKLIQMLDAGDSRMLNLFGNGGVDYLLAPKPITGDGAEFGLKDEDIEDTEDIINDSDNAGKSKILKIPLDKIDIGSSPVDLNVLETSTFAIKVLCFIYSFPYSMYEDIAKYSNQKEAKKLLYTQIGIPQATMIAQALTRFLGLSEQGQELYIDIDSIDALQDDKSTILDSHNKARTSINERRDVLGLERLKDKIYDEPVLSMGDQLGYIEDDGLGLDDGGEE